MKKLTSLLLALIMLFTAITLSGCDKKPDGYHSYTEYEHVLGQEHDTNHSSEIKMYAVSNSDTFDVDNVKLGLMYGIHTNYVIAGREDNAGKKEFLPFYHDDQYGEYTFAIYVCDIADEHSVEEYTIANILDIPEHELIKKISQSEAFSEDYGYALDNSLPFVRLTYYKHVEQITIPSSFVQDDKGAFVIKIIGFCEDMQNSEQIIFKVERIVCNYEKTGENTVKILFNEYL